MIQKKRGVIIHIVSNQYRIQIEDKVYEAMARGKLRQEENTPVVGDKVEISITENSNIATIEQILPRRNYCKRPKLANLTQILFVVSLKMPKPDLLLLDKQLAFAEWLGIRPIIILNKTDLIVKEQVIDEIAKVYEKIGYVVIRTNAKELTKEQINMFQKILKGNITAFSGNSGVGKSTLINALLGGKTTKEGEISKKRQRGKNTTTAITLYPIQGGYIADTPGFSTFTIEEIGSENLENYFIEFRENIKNCEYIGCSHVKEASCGIKQAMQEGRVTISRYENYCKIYQDLKEKEKLKW